MAALGAIGIQFQGAFKRLIPLPVTTPIGTAFAKTAQMRRILDVADAQNITKGFPRAVVQDFWRIREGRFAQYFSDFLQVRGHVKNSAGTGIARDVVIINRQGSIVGKVRSSAVDGSFKITVDNSGTNFLLVAAIPDDGDNRQAVPMWKVIPVTPT